MSPPNLIWYVINMLPKRYGILTLNEVRKCFTEKSWNMKVSSRDFMGSPPSVKGISGSMVTVRTSWASSLIEGVEVNFRMARLAVTTCGNDRCTASTVVATPNIRTTGRASNLESCQQGLYLPALCWWFSGYFSNILYSFLRATKGTLPKLKDLFSLKKTPKLLKKDSSSNHLAKFSRSLLVNIRDLCWSVGLV